MQPDNSLPAGRTKRAIVLVVDDVEGNRELACRRLAPFGYDLHQVESGEQALEFIRGRKPDIVLLDYMMPNMNGVEVLRVIRQDWQTSSIPVIMVTARAESEAVVEALDAGADDYVTKPIDFDVLRARIETQLVKQRSSKQLLQVNAALDERATMRVLAFDELRDELEREMTRRRQAEKALSDIQAQLDACNACGALPDWSGVAARPVGITEPGQRTAKASRALEIADAIARAVGVGKPVNPALLSALRLAVEELGQG
jgi:DNA-binding response OmpR family regulator